MRGNAGQRWSQEAAAQRCTQRLRLQYRAQLWRDLYGQLEAVYRRDDFPRSREVSAEGTLRRRTDQRLSGELRFDYQVWKQLSFNWGYTYEAQDSRRVEQEYGRHQIDAGFTFTF